MSIMDYNTLDKIVSNYIKSNDFYVQSISEIEKMASEILAQGTQNISETKWSKNIKLNDSINIVYDFLTKTNHNLALEFYNIMHSVDSNNNPIVTFIPREELKTKKDSGEISTNDSHVTPDGKVYIAYDETPNDLFEILHEMMHKMNDQATIKSDKHFQTYARDYFSETVSFTSEMLLGDYLVSNGIITENDFNLRKEERLNSCKEWSRNFIINAELIKMKERGQNISYENLSNFLSNYDKTSPIYNVLIDEAYDYRRVNQIIETKDMDLGLSQRYVLGYYLSDKISKSKNATQELLYLHNAVANPNTKINEVVDTIKRNLNMNRVYDIKDIDNLQALIQESSKQGLSDITITCDEKDKDRQKIIENNSGILECVYIPDSNKDTLNRKYKIDINRALNNEQIAKPTLEQICNIDRSDINKFKNNPSQNKVGPALLELSNKVGKIETKEDIKRLYETFISEFEKDTIDKKIHEEMKPKLFSRTSEEIAKSKIYTGCNDAGTLLSAILRMNDIPTIYVQAAKDEWIKDMQEGKPNAYTSLRGHIFLEVYLNDKWQLLDSMNGILYENYDYNNLSLPNGLCAFSKSLDGFSMGINSFESNRNITIDRFKDFDLSKYKDPNYEYECFNPEVLAYLNERRRQEREEKNKRNEQSSRKDRVEEISDELNAIEQIMNGEKGYGIRPQDNSLTETSINSGRSK